MTPSLRFRIIEAAAVLACIAAVSWSVLCVDFVPSNDGPQHTFAGFVKLNSAIARTEWAANYAPNNPLTSNGYMDLFLILEPRVGVELAHQSIILSVLLLWSFGWFFWVRSHVGPYSMLGFIAFPLSLQWIFWVGLYPFLLSSAFIPFVLLVRRRAGLEPSAMAVISVTLVFMARIHLFGAAMTGVILVFMCLADANRSKAFIRTTLVGLPSIVYTYLIGRNSETLEGGSGAVWDVPYDAVDLFLEFFLPGPLPMQLAFLALVALAAVAGLRAQGEHRLLLGTGLTMLVVGLALPIDWSGWELVRPRLLPTAYLLIIGSAVVPRRFNIAVATAVLMFAGWRFTWVTQLHRAAAEELAPMLKVAEALEMRDKRWLYVVADGPTPPAYSDIHLTTGFLHLTQMVAPRSGGMPFFSHDGDKGIHHIILKERRKRKWLGPVQLPSVVMVAWSPFISRRLRDLHISSYLSSMAWLDAIAVYGLPADGQTLADAGFAVRKVADSDDGHSLFVGEFVGCTWDLSIEGLREDTVVTIGFGTSTDMQDAFLVDVAGKLRIEDVPCGPSWFSVEAGCIEERTADGRVPVQPMREVAALVCHVPDVAEPESR